VIGVLSRPNDWTELCAAARQTVLDRFDLKGICLPAWLRIIGECVDRGKERAPQSP
jgi:hypothetical protein